MFDSGSHCNVTAENLSVEKRQANENDGIPSYVEILRGRDGIPGVQGPAGRDGIPGVQGNPGVQGPAGDGNKGEEGDIGPQGRAGSDGIDGEKGDIGPAGDCGIDGEKGMKGDSGLRGPMGPTGAKGGTAEPGPAGEIGLTGPQGAPGIAGVTYVRWGRTNCPNTTGTELVYTGRAAGTHYNVQGGTNDYLCLPQEPEYMDFTPGAQGWSPIYGAEYETHGAPLNAAADQNVPCVVCNSELRGSLLMIPARISCPTSWTLEYNGYLMTAHAGHHTRSAVCVDKDAEAIPGLDANTNGALFYHTEVVCNGIECPPYDAQKELTCAVCTK